MSLDIGGILEGWSYDPERISARRIEGKDGREKIQVRLDLGVLQMETTGRPDGERPHGCDSLLDYQEQRLRRHGGDGDNPFVLDSDECNALRSEGMMYYHRYLAEFILEDYDAVLRDTRRNLRLTDFLSAHAGSESDRQSLESYRPYVVMMYTRARALRAYRMQRPRAALAAVRKGVQRIEQWYERQGLTEQARESAELSILHLMESELATQVPADPVKNLREQLSLAVQEERYEDAAALRDRLRDVTGERI